MNENERICLGNSALPLQHKEYEVIEVELNSFSIDFD